MNVLLELFIGADWIKCLLLFKAKGHKLRVRKFETILFEIKYPHTN